MSSREIAEVVDSRHDKVKQSIDRLVQRGVIVQPPMGDEQDIDAMGRARTTSVYLVSKRDSYVVVAQLSPEFTARLVDRWQELEDRATQPALPNFSDPVVAARAWADAIYADQIKANRQIELREVAGPSTSPDEAGPVNPKGQSDTIKIVDVVAYAKLVKSVDDIDVFE